MSAFGAGGLGSYMGGGYDTPTQSTYAGNGQTILLLFVAAAVCMFLMVANITTSGNTGGTTGDENGNGGASGGGSGGASTTVSSSNALDGLEMFNISQDYANQAALDDMDVFNSLSEMEVWVSAGDNDMLLKMLENKTYGWGD